MTSYELDDPRLGDVLPSDEVCPNCPYGSPLDVDCRDCPEV